MNQIKKAFRLKSVALALLLGLGWGGTAGATTYVYVSNADDADISMYRLDEQSGALSGGERVKAGPVVMPLAISPDKQHLYAAVRSKPYRVVSYAIDPRDGRLTEVKSAALPESMPSIATDRSGRFLLATSYGGNLVSVSRVAPDGVVAEPAHQVIPTGRNAHAIVLDRTNRFAFASNLGSEQLVQWTFDASTGRLTSNTPGTLQMGSPTGPRHFAVAPDNRFLYVLNEFTAKVNTFSIDAATGLLTPISEAPGLPSNSTLANGSARAPVVSSAAAPVVEREVWAADIHMTPDGKFMYISERTDSTLSVLSVDAATGKLAYVGSVPTEKQPRSFAIDDSGRFIVVSGEKSPMLSVHRIDPATGTLTLQGRYPAGKGASWVEIVRF